MWSSKKRAAMAIVGASLAVAAATPTSAQYWSGYTEYSVYGPNPWNQGAWGGPWHSGPAYDAFGAAYGAAYAAVPAIPAVPGPAASPFPPIGVPNLVAPFANVFDAPTRPAFGNGYGGGYRAGCGYGNAHGCATRRAARVAGGLVAVHRPAAVARLIAHVTNTFMLRPTA